MLNPLKYLTITFPLVMFSIIISYFYLDRDIAIFTYHLFADSSHKELRGLGADFTFLVYTFFLLVFCCYFYLKWQKKTGPFLRCINQLSASIVFSYFGVNALKFFFGRISPLNNGHLSFLTSPHSYNLHWFYLSGQSFPSGHACIYTAFMVSVWLYYPKIKSILILFWLILAGLLIMLNLHYLSDVIGGTYLGASVAFGLYYLKHTDPDYSLN